MIDLKEALGFSPLSSVIKHYKLNVDSSITNNIYVRYTHLPAITSFQSKMDISRLMSVCISILSQNLNSNVLTMGCSGPFSKSASEFAYKKYSPCLNTTTLFFKRKEISRIFARLGDELSIFLITKCDIIEVFGGEKNVVIAGNVVREFPKSKKSTYSVDRTQLFHKANLQKLDLAEILRLFNHICTHKSNLIGINSKGDYIHTNSLGIGCVRVEGLKKFVRRYNNLNLNAIFVSKFKDDGDILEGRPVISCAVNPQKIVEFLFCVSKRILTGCISYYNIRILKRKLFALVLKNKFETIEAYELRWGFSMNDPSLFRGRRCKRGEFAGRCNIFSAFIHFILSNVFVPIISKYFYATETSSTKLRVFFFVRSVWNSLSSTEIEGFLRKKYDVIRRNNVNSSICRIRAIPKGKSFRMIAGMRRCSSATTVLSVLTEASVELLKDTVKSYKDAFSIINQFKSITTREDVSELYLLKYDIKDCFDNIRHDLLRTIIQSILSKERYIVRRYYLLERSMDNWKVRVVKICANSDDSFMKLLGRIPVRPNQVIQDGVYFEEIARDEVLRRIEGSVLKSVVKYNNKCYARRVGIPQGSVISPLLCNLYLAHIENTCIRRLANNCVILRYFDDVCLASRSIESIKRMFSAASNLERYGVIINTEKIEANFPVRNLLGDVHGPCETKVYVNWCGLRLYSPNLSVKCGFDIGNLMHSFSFNTPVTGRSILLKIIRLFKRRSCPILISKCNPFTLQNTYDTFFILAKKTLLFYKRAGFVNPKCIQRAFNVLVFLSYDMCIKTGVSTTKKKIREIGKNAFLRAGLGDYL